MLTIHIHRRHLFAFVLVLAAFLGIRLALAWTEPTQSPPNGDIFLPAAQWTASGTAIYNSNSGNVGIGLTNPGQKFSVSGTIESTSGGFKFPDGTTQTTTAAGGASQWNSSGTAIYNSNSGNVGIGLTNPGQKLSVTGTIESTSGGFKFPDGTTQTTTAGAPPTGFVNNFTRTLSNTTVQNTTAETDLWTHAVGNFLGTDGVIEYTTYAYYSTAASPGNITIRIRDGAGTLLVNCMNGSGAATLPANAANRPVIIRTLLRARGSTTSQDVFCEINTANAGAGSFPWSPSAISEQIEGAGGSLGAGTSVKMTVQFSVAAAANILTAQFTTVHKVF